MAAESGEGKDQGSGDPNQKRGPSGFGTAGYISPSTPLPYRIDFENDATATAPAQFVTLTDQLDPDLDWSTFALTEIGFGDHLIAIPANAQHFETTVPVHYNGQDFEVQIEAGINLSTGQVFAHYYSIDPDTSLPPDVLTGFLPPEDGTGRGMGHVSYLIDQTPGLATGTEIRSIALISFDGQPWIATNQVDPHNPAAGTDPAKEAFNTIDAGAPTSSVQPLSPTRTEPDFLVQWTATEDAGGSGIASHDIYVSTDGASYALWKDDTTATSATFSGQAGHSYAFYSVAQDHVGNTEAAPATADATTQVVDGLAVTAVSTDASGASIRFNRPLDAATLNLYATETGGQGTADVTLVGAASGAVTGSLVLDDDLQGFRFVKTGGPLAPDTYTLTLRSAADGIIDTRGRLLDGDDDGTPGGDSVTTLTVAGPLARVLSLPDVVRGPGQPVNIPATVSGIPIRLSDGTGVESLQFTLNYDPALLTLSDATLAASLPAGSTLVANLSVAGQLRVAMSFPTPLGAGAQDLLTLSAAIPETAPYRAKQVLDLNDVSLNEGHLEAVGDDAVHLVAYFGDTTGNGTYSSLDGQRVLRQTVGLDSGFAAYPLADPVLVADITGNGAVSSLDATRVLQEVVGLDRPEIPPLPGIPITPAGADPYVHIATDLTGAPGSMITVPVLIDDAVDLEAADLRLSYDATLLEVVAVRAGSVTTGATIITNPTPASNATGTLTVGLALTTPRPAGGGSLLEIDFRIKPTATSGATALNLTQVSLNEDGLVLSPLPVPGHDGSDGILTIRSTTPNTPPVAVADSYTTAEDSPLTITAPGLVANDTDAERDPLTAALVDGPTHGTLSLTPDGGFTYTPAADYSGPDRFSYKLNDGKDDSIVALVSLTVTPVNDPPVARDDAFTLHEDLPLSVPAAGVLANDADIDTAPLTAALVEAPQHGTLVLAPDGGFLYTPNANYNGADSFTYRALDDVSQSGIVTVSLTVNPVNDRPDAADDTGSGDEDLPITGNVLTNDSDSEGDSLSARQVSGPAHGILSFGPEGAFSYTPNPDFNGSDSFTYRANDGQVDSNLAVVSLTVRPVNDAPVAVDDLASTLEDTAVVLNLVGNDSDVDSNTLSVVSLTTPLHGSVVLNADGTVTYTPDANYFGADSFTYKANDGQVDSANIATVSMTITAVNDAPVAVDDAATTAEDTPVVMNLVANDTDVDSSTLSVVSLTQPLHGSTVLNPDGTVTYTPAANYNGPDSFTYRANDSQADSANAATVSVTITPVNDAPVAVNDSTTTTEDTPVVLNLTANDTDVDSSTLSVVSLTQPLHGAAVVNADGTVTYTPDANYFGADSFTYGTNDGQADSANIATVSVTITPVNDAPVAVDDTTITLEDTPIVLNLVANDSDIDSNTLSVVPVTDPLHGSTVRNADGTVTYTPDANYFGTDTFTYRSSDGSLESLNAATVTIVVGSVNNPPVAVDDIASTSEDTAIVLNLVANDTDVDSSALSVVSLTQPLHGTAVLNADGTVTYMPAANYNGADSFTYKANDGRADSANAATVSVTITPANDRPTIDPIATKTVNEGSLLSFTVSASDSENDTLVYSLDAAPAGATLDASSGLFSWTPADGPATTQVTVRATDSHGTFDTASFSVSVLNVTPTLGIAGAGSATQGQPYTLELSAADPGQDSISGWIITWGDGNVQNVAGNPSAVTHTYSAAGAVTLSASATDEDGTYHANTLSVNVTAPATFRVSQFTPTSTGFHVSFNRPIDPSALNLYDTESGGLDAADVTLTGSSSGLVRGSMVLDADAQGITFLRSGGLLAADTYTVRLASGAKAFKDSTGGALDGNGDGTPGDAFNASFIMAAPGRTLSLPDFMRGPGQFVDLTAPSQNGFLPLYLSDGAGVTSVEFSLHYDPAQLDLQALSAGANLSAGATIERLTAPAGVLKVRITSPTALAAGKVHLLNIQAFVPTTATYGKKEVLDLADVRVNGAIAADDDALQLVGYFGDTSGNGAYSTLDGQQIQRVLVKLDSGFAAYVNVDPLIIADINGSGTLTSIDASRVLQEVSYLTGVSGAVDRPEIPPIPTGIEPLTFSGPDPRVDIPIDAIADPGEGVTVPVRIDTTAGLESVQLRIGYDASRFDLVAVRRGSVSGDFDWFISGNKPGRVTVDMSRLVALPGVTAIDLQYASLNDGRVTIVGKAAAAATPVVAPLAATASETLPQAKLPIFAGGWYAALAPGNTPGKTASAAPVIDLAAGFTLPTAVSEAIVADGKSKPWLKDYLGNVGQAQKASPNAGLRVTVPVSPAATGANR